MEILIDFLDKKIIVIADYHSKTDHYDSWCNVHRINEINSACFEKSFIDFVSKKCVDKIEKNEPNL